MDEKTLKQLTREYEQEMPQEILKMINEFDWKRELRGIVRENNLMLDVGTDLEESVYLMLIGAIKVEDVYDRLVDTHELPAERVQKVLYEVENKIFSVLARKITQIDGDDLGIVEVNKTENTTVPEAEHSRDSILAEIENEELDARPLASNIVMPGNRTMPGASMETTSVSTAPTTSGTAPASIPVEHQEVVAASPTTSTGVEDRLGLRGGTSAGMPVSPKPFTLGQDTDPSVQVSISRPELAMGVQSDPVASGLTKPTMTTAPASQPGQGARVVDPYREPIE